jgi:hypothetical protein
MKVHFKIWYYIFIEEFEVIWGNIYENIKNCK